MNKYNIRKFRTKVFSKGADTKYMRQTINLNELLVLIELSDESQEITSFHKVSEYALKNKDLSLCPELLASRKATRGSVTFTLVTVG